MAPCSAATRNFCSEEEKWAPGAEGIGGWCAIQGRHDLAPDINPGVIVVVEFRRAHAEAHEDDLAFGGGIGRKRVASHHVILVDGQGPSRSVVFHGERTLVTQQFDLPKMHVLEIRSAHARGFQSHFLELRPHIIRRQLIAARAGAATFQQIIRQKRHVRPQSIGGNALQEFFRRVIGSAGLAEPEGNRQNHTEE